MVKGMKKMLLTNNARKMAGLPLHRKANRKKRHYSRNESWETVCAFLDWCNQ